MTTVNAVRSALVAVLLGVGCLPGYEDPAGCRSSTDCPTGQTCQGRLCTGPAADVGPGAGGTGGVPMGGTPVGGSGGTPVGGTPVGGDPVGGDPVGGSGGTPVGGTQAGGSGGMPIGGSGGMPIGGSGGMPVGGSGGMPIGGSGGMPVGGTPVGGDPVGGTPVGGHPMGGTPVGGDPVGGAGGVPVGGHPVGGAPVGGDPTGGSGGTGGEPPPPCPDTDGDGQPGAPETCNGLDDDCNGALDEGFGVGDICDVGVGACLASGHVVCLADGSAACDVAAGDGSGELCNGLDDDCNGVTDDLPGLGDGCSTGVGACRGEGHIVCDLGGERPICNAVEGAPGVETCDGIDNDCDDAVDDGFDLGAPCQIEPIAGCIRLGTRQCNPDGSSSLCVPVPAGSCDGLDNDCDGDVDEIDTLAGDALFDINRPVLGTALGWFAGDPVMLTAQAREGTNDVQLYVRRPAVVRGEPERVPEQRIAVGVSAGPVALSSVNAVYTAWADSASGVRLLRLDDSWDLSAIANIGAGADAVDIALSDAGVLVVWSTSGSVWARLVGLDGAALGVGTQVAIQGGNPRVETRAGGFAVVFEAMGEAGESDIWIAYIDEAGGLAGEVGNLSRSPARSHNADIARLDDGSLAVAWQERAGAFDDLRYAAIIDGVPQASVAMVEAQGDQRDVRLLTTGGTVRGYFVDESQLDGTSSLGVAELLPNGRWDMTVPELPAERAVSVGLVDGRVWVSFGARNTPTFVGFSADGRSIERAGAYEPLFVGYQDLASRVCEVEDGFVLVSEVRWGDYQNPHGWQLVYIGRDLRVRGRSSMFQSQTHVTLGCGGNLVWAAAGFTGLPGRQYIYAFAPHDLSAIHRPR
jgi:hypothetical protein